MYTKSILPRCAMTAPQFDRFQKLIDLRRWKLEATLRVEKKLSNHRLQDLNFDSWDTLNGYSGILKLKQQLQDNGCNFFAHAVSKMFGLFHTKGPYINVLKTLMAS